MVEKHSHRQTDTAPERQQTLSAIHQSTKGGAQPRQEHQGKHPASPFLQSLKQRVQTANKSHSSGLQASKDPLNHAVKDYEPHEARLSDKRPSSQAARDPGSQTSHQVKAPKKPARQAAVESRTHYEERLKVSVPTHQKPPHNHSSSHRAQTQTPARIRPTSSSSLLSKPRHKQEEVHLPSLAKENEDEAWSDRNVAIYEQSKLLPEVVRQTNASTTTAFPTPKPLAPRKQQSPPRHQRPCPTSTHSKAPPRASRKQENSSIIGNLGALARRDRERRAKALRDFAADYEEHGLPEEGYKQDELSGEEIGQRSWKTPPKAAASFPSSHRSTHHSNNTPTQKTAGNDGETTPLGLGVSSAPKNLPGLYPGSLPSLPPNHNLEDESNNGVEAEQINQDPPKGPFSLNSTAGIRAVEKTIPPAPRRPMVLPYETSTSSSRTTAQRFINSGGTNNNKDNNKDNNNANANNANRRAKIAAPNQNSPLPTFLKPSSFPSKSQQLYITSHDMHLYKWRQQKLTWAETRENWSNLAGADTRANRSEDSLRARFRAVQKAIEDDGVSQELCSAVLEGVEGAEEELNRVVAEIAAVANGGAGGAGIGGVANGGADGWVFQKINKNGGVKQESGRQQQHVLTSRRQISTRQESAAAGSARPTSPPLRATQGGKFYDARTFQAYIEHMGETVAEAFQDSEDSVDSDNDEYRYDSRQASPVRDIDCIQWEYYMQRRDFTAEDLAALSERQQEILLGSSTANKPSTSSPHSSSEEHDDEEEEEDPSEPLLPPTQTSYKTYTHPFPTLSAANAEASRFLFATPHGSPQTYSPTNNFSLSNKIDKHGMNTFTLRSSLGTSQVRVQRRLLGFGEFVLPAERGEKEGWVPRVFWGVVVKVRYFDNGGGGGDGKKGVGGVAGGVAGGEGKEETTDHLLLNNKIYSSLALANSRAVDEWLRLTLKPRSRNLNQVQVERELARVRLLRGLLLHAGNCGYGYDDNDDYDGDGQDGGRGRGEKANLFRQVSVEEGTTVEGGGSRRVEVFVQEVGLEGPRN